MASLRASRWPPPPPPLLLLLLLLLLLPTMVLGGTRGQPASPVLGMPLTGAWMPQTPEGGPEWESEHRDGPTPPDPRQAAPGLGAPTRRGHPGLVPRGGSTVTVRNHWQSSSTEPHLASSPMQEDFATVASREGMMGQISRESQAAASRVPEILTLLTGAVDAEARTGSSSADFPTSPVGQLPDSATAVTSQSSTFVSGSVKELSHSSAAESPVVGETKRMHAAATTFTDGVPRMLRSLTVSLQPANETEGFSEDSKTATTSTSPSVEESRRNSSLSRSLGGGEFTELSTEDEFGHTSLHWQSDSPITGLSYSQAGGTVSEQRTSSDHTYVSSTFTKGERTLLSITDQGSSSDIQESSTSYTKISNSSHVDYPSSSHAQTGRNAVSSYHGEYARPSTESLVLRTSDLPSYTSTLNVPNTLFFLDANAQSVDDSSSSSAGLPLSLPSVSQSHQMSLPTIPLTGASAYPLRSTSEASGPLSPSPSPSSVSLMASSLAPLSVSQTALPYSPSTPVLPRVGETSVASVETSTGTSSMAVLYSSQTADPGIQSIPYQEHISTQPKSPSLVPLSTEPTKTVKIGSPPSGSPLPTALPEFATKPTIPATSTNVAQTSPDLTTAALGTSHTPTSSMLSSTAVLMTGPVAAQTTTGKQLSPTHPEMLGPHIPAEGATTTKTNQVHVDATTQRIPLTSAPTSAKELTTSLGVMEEDNTASHFFKTSPSQTTVISTAETLAPKPFTSVVESSTLLPPIVSSPASVDRCAPNPCLHGGKCIMESTSRGYRCVCLPSWQGSNCSVDVNECLLKPCPPLATCNNTQGSYICKCPVGYQLEKGICNLVRTFVTEFKLKKIFLNTTGEKHPDLPEVQNEITKTLNMCFSPLPGYIRSTVHASRESSVVAVSLQTTFSLASNVTLFDLADGIQRYVNSCRSSAEICQLLGSQRRIFRAGSLCKRKSPECDKETSICTDLDGIALCQCKSGYFQFNKMDHSCRACEDGYRLENETCMSCPFGLGGLNCGNPYQLITVVIAAAGGGLLLILGIALIVTCCRKNKNDISKLIFKSGDFQMSPYAEYPKNPRSQEWGREAIEMHENGSTKNLLQMTDVYYSPTSVRNPELERNGLYPAYTGLPGSRHSCIFPGQYNPSFISDESRRRDYF
ncbi:protein HEG homolog 1 isoform X2 [Ochotona princeps]|uniref:protein HEG homolog 1 isoform X2 n=1 Tax=Ochotona princeps TaxID=9978 RepID=UPI00271499F5|nr:protein HEG homolog 1 isoform X2 [Ochotona princeps]